MFSGWKLALSGLVVAAAATYAGATLQLVDSTTQNGSFESGVTSPWNGFSSGSVVSDASLATDGSYYLRLSKTVTVSGVNDVPVLLTLPLSPSDGRTVDIAFDARIDPTSSPFDQISLSASAVGQTTQFLQNSGPRSDQWFRYVVRLTFPQGWTGGSFTFGPVFTKFSPVVGNTYTGYVDNITVVQTPEPSLSFGAVIIPLAFCRRTRRSR